MPPAAINRPPAAPAPQSPWPPHARVIKKRIGGTPSRRRRRKAARAFYAPHAWGALESRPFTTDHPRDCGERLRTLYHRVAACPWGLSFAASNRPWAEADKMVPYRRVVSETGTATLDGAEVTHEHYIGMGGERGEWRCNPALAGHHTQRAKPRRGAAQRVVARTS